MTKFRGVPYDFRNPSMASWQFSEASEGMSVCLLRETTTECCFVKVFLPRVWRSFGINPIPL